MPTRIDVDATMKAVLAREDLFKGVGVAAETVALKAIAKRLRTRPCTVAVLREVYGSIGDDTFRVVLEAMTAIDAKDLLRMVDPTNPERPCKVDAAARIHALASGKVEPLGSDTHPLEGTHPQRRTPSMIAEISKSMRTSVTADSPGIRTKDVIPKDR